MALPASGPISFQNFNTDRGLSATAQIDIDTAAIAYGIPTKPHSMDEFYGRSVTGTTTTTTSTTTSTTTTTTAAPIESWIAERNDGNAVAFVGPYSTWSGTFGVGSSVVVNDGSGICWTLMSESTAPIQFTITGVCPPPTTTTTAAPTTTSPPPRPTTTTTEGPIQ